jgi:1-pyrroline-5-carboxylate dehydrogenase
VENEPVLSYNAGSSELSELETAIKDLMSNSPHDIPLVVNGKEIRSGTSQKQVFPFDHGKTLAHFYHASPAVIEKAIHESVQVRKESWDAVPLQEKISMFLRAGDLVSGKYRMKLNAATILGQSKTVIQAEIDAAAELADFFRFNAMFAEELLSYQPISTDPSVTTNTFRYRSLEGFIASISPFNFTAIGGNLASGPTLMGNVVLWKPSDTAILSNYIIFKLLEEAGFPPGVINFLPSNGPVFGSTVTKSPELTGVNFTGSVATFKTLWKMTAENLDTYKSYPRLVGECGGKNFHFVHPSAEVKTVAAATIRSAFEFSGQKCSACSRMYVPGSLWKQVKQNMLDIVCQIKVGSPLDYSNFMSAVIDEAAFKRISSYIDDAKTRKDETEIITGGTCDKSKGYFINPTIIQVKNPRDRLMTEEIFGPVLTVFVYEDSEVDKVVDLIDSSTAYALTGAVFAQDRKFLNKSSQRLKYAAGNFYINDKSTGSVVGQQPFGGSRMSGTNDKAGGPHYLLRWASPQNVKETFIPQTEWRYPYMNNTRRYDD